MPASLFDIIVPSDRLNPVFAQFAKWRGHEPARALLDEVFLDFDDADGNFVDQFQSAGFDARIWELYLFACFKSLPLTVERPRPSPDFKLIDPDGRIVFVEAVTSNPSEKAASPFQGVPDELPSKETIAGYIRNEMPIKAGSALFSKLSKRYWERAEVKGRPLVLALECFHDEWALTFADSAVQSYLYGIEQTCSRDEHCRLVIETRPIEEHALGTKRIPSGFFNQPGAEHISAVVISNSGTAAKFQRMACQSGRYRDKVEVIRYGKCYDQNPNSSEPLRFQYVVGDPAWPESWGQGLSVSHNPHALYPLNEDFFPDAAHHKMFPDGQFRTMAPPFHPFSSLTHIYPQSNS